MKGKILGLMVGFLLIGFNLFAADGDLIVNGKVGIGTTGPLSALHIVTSGTAIAPPSSTALTLQRSAASGSSVFLDMISGNAGDNAIIFGDTDDTEIGSIYYRHALNAMAFYTNNNQRMVIDDTGHVGIGTPNPGETLHVARNDNGSDEIARFENQNTGASAQSYITLGTPTGTKGGYLGYDYANSYLFLGLHGATSTLNIKDGNVGIGITSPGSYRLYVSGTAYSTGGWYSSDQRFKENIMPIESPLNKILNLRGVTFNWKAEEFEDKGFPGGRHHGVIAQEIEKVLPEIVKEGPEGEKGVSYTEIIPVLIEAMKDQHKEIERLKSEVAELKAMK